MLVIEDGAIEMLGRIAILAENRVTAKQKAAIKLRTRTIKHLLVRYQSRQKTAETEDKDKVFRILPDYNKYRSRQG